MKCDWKDEKLICYAFQLLNGNDSHNVQNCKFWHERARRTLRVSTRRALRDLRSEIFNIFRSNRDSNLL